MNLSSSSGISSGLVGIMSNSSSVDIQNSYLIVNIISLTQGASGIAGVIRSNSTIIIINSSISGFVKGNGSSGYLAGVIDALSNISVANSKLCFSGPPP